MSFLIFFSGDSIWEDPAAARTLCVWHLQIYCSCRGLCPLWRHIRRRWQWTWQSLSCWYSVFSSSFLLAEDGTPTDLVRTFSISTGWLVGKYTKQGLLNPRESIPARWGSGMMMEGCKEKKWEKKCNKKTIEEFICLPKVQYSLLAIKGTPLARITGKLLL